MTYSLKLQNGDLSFGSKGLEIVDNESKMIQDLSLELKQKMGTDEMHPDYGSLIDGGENPDGFIYESIIGESDLSMVDLRVRSEILRIVGNYQQRQLARAKADKMKYNSQTLTKGEVLIGIDNIDIIQKLDRLDVKVHLITASGSTQTVEFILGI
jgi:hypothetical protein